MNGTSLSNLTTFLQTNIVVRGLSIEASVRLLTFIADVLISIILARTLSTSGLGQFGTVFLIVSFASLWCELGGKEFLVRSELQTHENMYSTIMSVSIILTACVTIVVLATADSVANILGGNGTASLLTIGSFMLVKTMTRIPQGLWESRFKFGYAQLPELSSQIILVILLTAYMQSGRLTVDRVLWLNVVCTWINLSLSICLSWRFLNFRFESSTAMSLLRYGWPLLISSILSYIIWQGDDWMVRLFKGDAELGGYAVAFNAPRYMTQFISMSGVVLMPILVHYKERIIELQNIFSAMNYLFAIVLIPIAIIIILFPQQLLTLVYGAKWSSFSSTLAIFTFAFLIRAITGYHWTILPMIYGENRFLVIGNIINILVLVAVGSYFISSWGAVGGAYTNLIVVLVGVLPLRLYYIKQKFRNLDFLFWLRTPLLIGTVLTIAIYISIPRITLEWYFSAIALIAFYALSLIILEKHQLQSAIRVIADVTVSR